MAEENLRTSTKPKLCQAQSIPLLHRMHTTEDHTSLEKWRKWRRNAMEAQRDALKTELASHADDREWMLKAVKQCPICILDASPHLQEDPTFVIQAIQQQQQSENFWWTLVHYSQLPVLSNWKDEKSIILAAISKYGGNTLKDASERLKNDSEVVEAAVSNSGKSLQHASMRLRDDHNLVAMAIGKDALALEFASQRLRDDQDLVLMAIRKDWSTLRFASSNLQRNKDVVKTAIAINGDAWGFAKYTDKDLALFAVKKDPFVVRFSSPYFRDPEVVATAILTAYNNISKAEARHLWLYFVSRDLKERQVRLLQVLKMHAVRNIHFMIRLHTAVAVNTVNDAQISTQDRVQQWLRSVWEYVWLVDQLCIGYGGSEVVKIILQFTGFLDFLVDAPWMADEITECAPLIQASIRLGGKGEFVELDGVWSLKKMLY
jgi:hypothetical protein